VFHLSIKGYAETRPHHSYCFLSMFKLYCKRHYRNLATYSWCRAYNMTWRRHEDGAGATPTFGRRRRRRRRTALFSWSHRTVRLASKRRGRMSVGLLVSNALITKQFVIPRGVRRQHGAIAACHNGPSKDRLYTSRCEFALWELPVPTKLQQEVYT